MLDVRFSIGADEFDLRQFNVNLAKFIDDTHLGLIQVHAESLSILAWTVAYLSPLNKAQDMPSEQARKPLPETVNTLPPAAGKVLGYNRDQLKSKVKGAERDGSHSRLLQVDEFCPKNKHRSDCPKEFCCDIENTF
jgi:hypothetical protein